MSLLALNFLARRGTHVACSHGRLLQTCLYDNLLGVPCAVTNPMVSYSIPLGSNQGAQAPLPQSTSGVPLDKLILVFASRGTCLLKGESASSTGVDGKLDGIFGTRVRNRV